MAVWCSPVMMGCDAVVGAVSWSGLGVFIDRCIGFGRDMLAASLWLCVGRSFFGVAWGMTVDGFRVFWVVWFGLCAGLYGLVRGLGWMA